jgi:3-oxoacyl-[acyl-carrier-protein] synthase-1
MAGLAHLGEPDAASRWALFLATPAADRVGVGAEDAAGFADDVKEGALFPLAPVATSILSRGHAGALLALRQAMAELVEGRWDVCVVGGVDSLLESEWVSAAIGEKKLKTASSTSGYIPGEAAAFVVLEAADHARQRGATILAHVTPVRSAHEAAPAYAESPGRAEGVAAVLRQSVADAPCGPAGLQRIINDLNGERWRFLEWAMADGRVLSNLPPHWRLWHPADCFGDIGAATGAAHLCMAVRAFERSYAVGEAIVVCNSSEAGERASTVVYPASAEA